MFGKKKSRAERSFSMMLVEELLRAELRKLYGDAVKFFHCDTVATAACKPRYKTHTLTKIEQELHWADKERFVTIDAVIGPFERVFPNNPPEDKRCRARKVKAQCRLFSIEGGCTFWRPHFLVFTVTDDNGGHASSGYCYEDGVIDDLPQNMLGFRSNFTWEVVQNPCADMCYSQVQPGTEVSTSNWGQD